VSLSAAVYRPRNPQDSDYYRCVEDHFETFIQIYDNHYDRKLLADLSRSAWESLKVFLREAVPEKNPIPGAVIAIQTFGDFLGFNLHCHILVTDGCFYGDRGMFREDCQVIRAILEHLGLWLARARPPPKIHDPPVCVHNTGRPTAEYFIDDYSQLPLNEDHLYRDPEYSWDD
jgi:hypothetical protein